MLHIQSSTLAGGIAVGTVANVILYPHHAIIVGCLTGLISVVGHVAITVCFITFISDIPEKSFWHLFNHFDFDKIKLLVSAEVL